MLTYLCAALSRTGNSSSGGANRSVVDSELTVVCSFLTDEEHAVFELVCRQFERVALPTARLAVHTRLDALLALEWRKRPSAAAPQARE